MSILKKAKDKVTKAVGAGISNVINYEKNQQTKRVNASVDRHLARTAEAKVTMAKHHKALKNFGGTKDSDWSPYSPEAYYARKRISDSTAQMKGEVDRINNVKKKKKEIPAMEPVSYDRSGKGVRGGGRRGDGSRGA